MAKVSFIKTDKTVSETLRELRVLFKKQGIEDWEPMLKRSAKYEMRKLSLVS